MKTLKKPDAPFKDRLAAAKAAEKGLDKVDKRVTVIRNPEVKEADALGDGGVDGGLFSPSEEQLERINKFTRRLVSADEVAVFNTLSCNDLIDRDLDRFTTQTVKDFAALEHPYSSIGKSFMVNHDYSKAPVGRIFGAGTKKVNGATFLTNEVYVPNTDQYKNYLENVEFGINWAVSVGVMLDANNCSICGNHMYSFGFCQNGHMKGQFYPEGDEGDPSGWDWAEPVAEGTKGAVQCTGIMEGARDFYELSSVFLGAQFFAELSDKSAVGGVIKAAGAKERFLSLSAKEASELPIPHLPEKVVEAEQKFSTEVQDDGSIKWVDKEHLVWVFDPETSEVSCLGKSASQDEGEVEEDAEANPEAGGDEDALGSSDGEHDASGSGADGDDSVGEDPEGSDPDEEQVGQDGDLGDQEEDVDKAVVIAAVRSAGLPDSVLDALKTAKGNGLAAAFQAVKGVVDGLTEQVTALTAKKEIADQYIKDLRADAIDWYVKAHQVEGKGVSTTSFEKILDACGENLDLIKMLGTEQKALAQAKFPGAIRRSTADPDDPNTRRTLDELPSAPVSEESSRTVSRIHG